MTALILLLLSAQGWAADLEIDGAGANPDDTLGGLFLYDNVRIVNGGVLHVNGTLHLTARSVFVDATSRIVGTGGGVQGVFGGGSGVSGGGMADDAGGGGGHGGIGGAGFDATCLVQVSAGGALVGNSSDGLIEQGQPGGGVTDGTALAAGGAGGAALHIAAEIVQILGTIEVNGDPGQPGGWGGGGGGAGGSVFLEADTLLCDGRIEAKGGDGASGQSHGGGGGGGIVELGWDSTGRVCDVAVAGGRGECGDGAAGLASGLPDQDWDGDGFAVADGDCEPTDAAIGPGSLEAATCDGVDQNCTGVADDGLNCGFGCTPFAADDSTYLSCETNATYDTAVNNCRGLSGGRYFAAVIGSNTENAALVAGIAVSGDTESHWIGLDDQALEDGWGWRAPVDTVYVNWANGEPNDFNGEDCGEFLPASGSWNDEDCTTTHDFLCERCDLVTWYTDADGDGFGDASLATEACDYDPPLDGALLSGDCDDADAAVFPHAPEACDGIDSDCDGTADPLTLTLYADADADGYGDPTAASVQQACGPIAANLVTNAADCDDGLGSVSPGELETCNGLDDDCDGIVDNDAVCEGSPEDCLALRYGDSAYLACNDLGTQPQAEVACDGLGYALASLTSAAEDAAADQLVDRVDPSVGFWIGLEDLVVEDTFIWADGTPFAFDDWNTGQPDNGGGGTQQDCAITSDDNNGEDTWFDRACSDSLHYLCEVPCTALDWYADADGDGWGDVGDVVSSCTPRSDRVLNLDDCDDGDPLTHPNAGEIPVDGVDQDCDTFDACFADKDSDGSGDPILLVIDLGGNGCLDPAESENDGDCDPSDSAVGLGLPEVVASGVDSNCDGFYLCYFDGDGDDAGTFVVTSPDAACTAPYEAAVTGDCDDANPLLFPGGNEIIGDGADQDCDNNDSCYQDLDADGYGDSAVVVDDNALDCDDGGPWSSLGGDCNDLAGAIGPGAPEVPADGIDQDCDAGDTCYGDGDGDGYAGGTLIESIDLDCLELGEAAVADDCDDDDGAVYPGATEVVGDGLDQDCDDSDSCYADLDGDTYGDDLSIVVDNALDCDDGGSRSSLPGDCDDTNDRIAPGAPDVPVDGIDQDCDQGDACYGDGDGDGFASDLLLFSSADLDCTDPGEFDLDEDCDDSDAAVFPTALEVVGDGLDQDCDGGDTCWTDADGDTFGVAIPVGSVDLDCSDPGESGDTLDCDDTASDAFPGGIEVIGDGIDQDCDGGETCYLDEDGDGHGTPATLASDDPDCTDPLESLSSDDCDDLNPDLAPDAPEIVGDGIDQDCDGVDSCFSDADLDGFGDATNPVPSADLDCDDPGESPVDGDCDDSANPVNPSGVEAAGNEVDEDCDGTLLCFEDGDGDGFGAEDGNPLVSADLDCDDPEESVEATDCDDTDPASNPGGTEIAGDGIDQDCDGVDATETDTDLPVTDRDPTEASPTGSSGCGCASGAPGNPTGIAAFALVGALLLRRRRA